MAHDLDAPRFAIVGAGPAGFYACEQLLRRGAEVDLYDALPTPFGLVRTGVAPDHPKIKSVTRIYERTAAQSGFRFFGGVHVGSDVTRQELRERYDGILYATGARLDKRLDIPGEGLPGSHAARDFVGWYNGHPDFADCAFNLSCRRAVIVGNGNVALDVARMLVLDASELARTDTADHALAALAVSRVREVVVLGRRGAAQAAFTNPELLELGQLVRADIAVDSADLELDPASAASLESNASARRNVEALRAYAARPGCDRTHCIRLRFLCSPVEVLGAEHGRVTGVRVARNRIAAGTDGRLRAVPTGIEQAISCGLVLRAAGYRCQPLDGLPFDEERGVIRNRRGRVVSDDGAPLPGEYVAGWSKRGATGVIGTNKKDAADTVDRVLDDIETGALTSGHKSDRGAVERWLRDRVPGLVSWRGWQTIDAHERLAGEPLGRPRIKVVHVARMREIARAGSGSEDAASRRVTGSC